MKKLVLILLALVMVLSFALAGCKLAAQEGTPAPGESDQPTDSGDGDDDSIYNELGTWPIVKDEYKDQIQFTVMVAPEPWLGDFNVDNFETTLYEKMSNMKVTFETIARESMEEKLNVILAAGGDSLPDVFMLSMGNSRLALYGAQGTFIPINEYVETVAPGMEWVLTLQPSALTQMTFPDGNMYGLPEINECYHCDISMRMWINSTWMEALELEAPTTTDEFADVLRKFRDDDPNGNGEKDEYPLVAPTDFWNGKIDGYLVNPFIICNEAGGGNRLYLDGDTIKCSAVQDGWKDAMKYLKMLYDEKLLDNDCFTSTTETLRPLTESETGNRIGAAPGGYIGGFVNMEGDKVYDYTWLDPLEGPAGRNIPFFYTGFNICYVITNQCEEPEAAFRWADMRFIKGKETQEGKYDTEEYGLGITYRLGTDEEFGLDGRSGKDNRLTETLIVYGEPHNWHWGQPSPAISTNEARFSAVSPTDKWYLETELYKARTSYTPYASQETTVPTLLMTDEEAERLSEFPSVATTISQWVAYFVTGEKDIDADWDEYLGLLDEYGLETIIEIYQTAYDRVY